MNVDLKALARRPDMRSASSIFPLTQIRRMRFAYPACVLSMTCSRSPRLRDQPASGSFISKVCIWLPCRRSRTLLSSAVSRKGPTRTRCQVSELTWTF